MKDKTKQTQPKRKCQWMRILPSGKAAEDCPERPTHEIRDIGLAYCDKHAKALGPYFSMRKMD